MRSKTAELIWQGYNEGKWEEGWQKTHRGEWLFSASIEGDTDISIFIVPEDKDNLLKPKNSFSMTRGEFRLEFFEHVTIDYNDECVWINYFLGGEMEPGGISSCSGGCMFTIDDTGPEDEYHTGTMSE